MTPDELLHLLRRYGVRARLRNDEVLVETCFACGNPRWNLELNADKGVFNCWACSYSGRLDALLGDQFGVFDRIKVKLDTPEHIRKPAATKGIPVMPVTEIPSARSYLEGRGITLAEMIRYRVGVCTVREHQWFGYVVWPLREYWGRKVIGSVGRVIPILGRYLPKYLQDFDADALPGVRVEGSREHALVEGIFDGLAVARQGVNAAVMLGVNKDKLVREWAALVPPGEPVYIVLDSDAVKSAKQLFWAIKPIHPNVHTAQLPAGRDAGSYLCEEGGLSIQAHLSARGMV